MLPERVTTIPKIQKHTKSKFKSNEKQKKKPQSNKVHTNKCKIRKTTTATAKAKTKTTIGKKENFLFLSKFEQSAKTRKNEIMTSIGKFVTISQKSKFKSQNTNFRHLKKNHAHISYFETQTLEGLICSAENWGDYP